MCVFGGMDYGLLRHICKRNVVYKMMSPIFIQGEWCVLTLCIRAATFSMPTNSKVDEDCINALTAKLAKESQNRQTTNVRMDGLETRVQKLEENLAASNKLVNYLTVKLLRRGDGADDNAMGHSGKRKAEENPSQSNPDKKVSIANKKSGSTPQGGASSGGAKAGSTPHSGASPVLQTMPKRK